MHVAHANTAWGDCSCLSLMGLTGTSNLKFFRALPCAFSLFFNMPTESNKHNVERKLDHLIQLIEILIEQYPHITCSERATMLATISMAAKQVTKNVGLIRETLLIHLIDEFGVDYSEYARKFENLQQEMRNKLAGAPMLVAIDTHTPPVTGTDKIMAYEKSHFNVTDITGLNRLDYCLRYFVENSHKLFNDIMESLTLIIADLRGIDDEDYYAMVDGKLDLEGAYEKLRTQYMELNGERDKTSIEFNLSTVLSIKGCTSPVLDKYMEVLQSEYDPITQEELNNYSPAKYIIKNRKTLTLEDLGRHFKNQMEWKFFKQKAADIRNAEKNGILPPKSSDTTIIIGPNIENQINNYNYYGRETN